MRLCRSKCRPADGLPPKTNLPLLWELPLGQDKVQRRPAGVCAVPVAVAAVCVRGDDRALVDETVAAGKSANSNITIDTICIKRPAIAGRK